MGSGDGKVGGGSGGRGLVDFAIECDFRVLG